MKSKLFLLALVLILPVPAAADDIGTLVGAAVRTRPTYDGSDRQTTDLIPHYRGLGLLVDVDAVGSVDEVTDRALQACKAARAR